MNLRPAAFFFQPFYGFVYLAERIAVKVFSGFFLIIFGHLFSQVTASRVYHQINAAVVVPVNFDKVVASAERAQAVNDSVHVDAGQAPELFKADVFNIRVRRLADVYPGRN